MQQQNPWVPLSTNIYVLQQKACFERHQPDPWPERPPSFSGVNHALCLPRPTAIGVFGTTIFAGCENRRLEQWETWPSLFGSPAKIRICVPFSTQTICFCLKLMAKAPTKTGSSPSTFKLVQVHKASPPNNLVKQEKQPTKCGKISTDLKQRK